MATPTLPVPVRPANPAIATASPGLSKTTTRAVDMARLHLRDRNPGAYVPGRKVLATVKARRLCLGEQMDLYRAFDRQRGEG